MTLLMKKCLDTLRKITRHNQKAARYKRPLFDCWFRETPDPISVLPVRVAVTEIPCIIENKFLSSTQ